MEQEETTKKAGPLAEAGLEFEYRELGSEVELAHNLHLPLALGAADLAE